MKINHLDLFSGIGGFSLGLEMAGIETSYLGFSDIDPHANKLFKRRFPHGEKLGSVTSIQSKHLPKIDLVTFGFPCQDLSIAGKRGGLQANRSSLFFEAIKIIRDTKPKYFIFENVKGIFSSNGGKDFDIVLRAIAEIGYDGQWQLCNTRWFLPQNRERIYFIGHIRGECAPKVFPIGEDESQDGNPGRRNQVKVIGHSGSGGQKGDIYSTEGLMSCLTATDYKQPKQIRENLGLKRLEDIDIVAKKRKYDTPKEINIYLKKHKNKSISEISKELNLPKTQVAHYFRKDKYRAIPSPEVWLQLKKILKFDDFYDKQVTEIYEKECSYDSSKRVYDSSGIAQTLDTGKSGLYKVEVADFRNDEGLRIRKDGVSPCLATRKHSETDISTMPPLIRSVAYRTRSYAGKEGTIEERDDNVSNALNSQPKDYMIKSDGIRRLPPTECESLQGFPDGWTDGQSDTQRYKQLGNAVSVPLVEAIMRRLYNKEN